jgi:hypothetical protein
MGYGWFITPKSEQEETDKKAAKSKAEDKSKMIQ